MVTNNNPGKGRKFINHIHNSNHSNDSDYNDSKQKGGEQSEVKESE
jgi:hypothetical protein